MALYASEQFVKILYQLTATDAQAIQPAADLCLTLGTDSVCPWTLHDTTGGLGLTQ